MESLLKKIELLKKMEKYIYFDWVLNIFLLVLGFKYVSRLENINQDNVAWVTSFFQSIWLYTHYEWKNMFVSKRELHVSSLDEMNAVDLWKALGFPECCCKSFSAMWWITDKNFFHYLTLLHSKDSTPKYKILTFFNWRWKLFFHLPCSLSCEETYKKAKIIYEKYYLISDYSHNLDFDTFVVLEELIFLRLLGGKIVSYGTFISWLDNNLLFKSLNIWNLVTILDDSIVFFGDNDYEYKRNFLIFNFHQ